MTLDDIIMSLTEEEAAELLSLSDEEFWLRYNNLPGQPISKWRVKLHQRNARRRLLEEARDGGWLV